MIFQKPALYFVSLVITALLMALTLGVVAGSSHVITDQDINVGPDGYWDAEVAAGGHQNWNFVLGADREHNIEIEIESPAGASLGISIDGTDFGTVSGDGNFTTNLGAGSHVVRIDNSGDAAVQYEFYMGGNLLLFTKTFVDNPVPPGGTTTLRFTIDNISILGAHSIVFKDNLGDTLPDLEAVGLPLNDVCGVGSIIDGAGLLAFAGGDLPPGGSCTFDVLLKVPVGAKPGTYLNTTSDLTYSAIGNPDLTESAAQDELKVSAESADLGIEKSDSPDPVVAGNQLTYTIEVTNNGPSDAQNVIVTDPLPAGVDLVSTNGCNEDPNAVPTCTLGTITANGSKQYTITVDVHPNTRGDITNVAKVASDTPEGNAGDESTSATTTVLGEDIKSVGGVTSFFVGRSGSSGSVALLAGAVTAVVIISAGGWYTRRRWLRS